jgi:hypothetical protein
MVRRFSFEYTWLASGTSDKRERSFACAAKYWLDFRFKMRRERERECACVNDRVCVMKRTRQGDERRRKNFCEQPLKRICSQSVGKDGLAVPEEKDWALGLFCRSRRCSYERTGSEYPRVAQVDTSLKPTPHGIGLNPR